jgi:hypothetical protein
MRGNVMKMDADSIVFYVLLAMCLLATMLVW